MSWVGVPKTNHIFKYVHYEYFLFVPCSWRLWSELGLPIKVISSTPSTVPSSTFEHIPLFLGALFHPSAASWGLGRQEDSLQRCSEWQHSPTAWVFLQSVLKWSGIEWVKKKFPLEQLIIACRYFFVWSRRGQFNRLCNTTKNKIALKEVSCWVTTLLPEPIRSQ